MHPEPGERERLVLGIEEQYFSSSLPSDYRRAIIAGDLKHEDMNFDFVETTATIERMHPLTVDHPFGVTLRDMIDIVRERDENEGRVSPHLLPIGWTYEYEQLLLAVDGVHRGSVFIKTYEKLRETGQDNVDDDIFAVADTYADFVKSLRPDG